MELSSSGGSHSELSAVVLCVECRMEAAACASVRTTPHSFCLHTCNQPLPEHTGLWWTLDYLCKAPSFQGLPCPAEHLHLRNRVHTSTAVFAFEHHKIRAHISAKHSDRTAWCLDMLHCLKSNGGWGTESWFSSRLHHCELLLPIDLNLHGETQMRDRGGGEGKLFPSYLPNDRIAAVYLYTILLLSFFTAQCTSHRREE